MRHRDPSRRALLAGAAATTASMALPTLARAGTYPSNNIRVVIPYAAGGGADTLGRVLCTKMSEDLGQALVVEDRGGGGATIGPAMVVNAAHDGYTVLYDTSSHSVNGALFKKLPFDYAKDFQPVGLAGLAPNLLVVHPSVEAKTVADIIALAKSTPGGLSWASSGLGAVQWLSEKLLAHMTGISLTDVPYKGGGPVMIDLIGGQVKFYFANAAGAVGYVKSGQVKAIAHTGSGRLADFPDLPPVSDTLPGFETYEWNGFFVPTGSPPESITVLNKALNAALADPAVAAKVKALSVITRPGTPEDFGKFVDDQITKWSALLREMNIQRI